MDLDRRLLSLTKAFLITLTLTGGVAFSASPDLVELRVRVDSVVAYRGQQNVLVPVWLDNYVDTIAGFSMWFQMDRPDIALFRPDTAGGGADTTGTLVAGWEYISTTSISGFGTDLNIDGLADMPGGDVTPGIPPQESSLPLFMLVADAFDSLGTVNILINPWFNFSFTRPNSSQIGMVMQEIVDTSYWLCLQWSGDTCLNWQQVPGPPYDSISVEIDTIMALDTVAVEIINGSITVVEGTCGDINGSGAVDVADLTFLVAYLFQGGPPPFNIWTADCDGSGAIDVTDLTCFVCYLFQGCPPPTCDIW